MKSVCLAILNYNGRKHLEHLLPTACAAAKNFSGACSILVLDNRSTENDVDWIRREFPAIEVVIAPKNDFLFSYNWLAENRSEDVMIFLNNDLRVSLNFIEALLAHFRHDDVFAVGATSRHWDDTHFTAGPVRLKSHHGVYYWDFERQRQELCHTLFCSGGFMAVDREKFLELGGFNQLFMPAYGEDLDLCFRAWRRGWRCIFEPTSVVYHRESASFSEVGSSRSAHLIQRAQFLFQWASLPLAAGWIERSVIQLLFAFRRLRAGDTSWATVWLRTWLEWRRVRMRYRWMKTSKEALADIQRRIEMPVASATFESKCRE